MKPEFPALDNAKKLVRNFCDFGLMRKFANLMDGIAIINNDGLKSLNEQYDAAYKSVDEAEKEALIVSQQANELTQQFYLDSLKLLADTEPFRSYSPTFLEDAIKAYNLQFADKTIDYTALVIYKMYLDSLVNSLNRICDFYKRHFERVLEKHSQIEVKQITKPSKKDKNAKPNKIKVRLTVNQLIYFFELLQHSRIMDKKSTKQIAEFISHNLYNDTSDNLSAKHIQNEAANPPSKIDAQFVKGYLNKMIEKINKEFK